MALYNLRNTVYIYIGLYTVGFMQADRLHNTKSVSVYIISILVSRPTWWCERSPDSCLDEATCFVSTSLLTIGLLGRKVCVDLFNITRPLQKTLVSRFRYLNWLTSSSSSSSSAEISASSQMLEALTPSLWNRNDKIYNGRLTEQTHWLPV